MIAGGCECRKLQREALAPGEVEPTGAAIAGLGSGVRTGLASATATVSPAAAAGGTGASGGAPAPLGGVPALDKDMPQL